MTDSQSINLFWCQATFWDPQPIFLFPSMEIIFRQLLVSHYFGALSDEKVGL
jgi:hypothetical protein